MDERIMAMMAMRSVDAVVPFMSFPFMGVCPVHLARNHHHTRPAATRTPAYRGWLYAAIEARRRPDSAS